MYRLYNPNPAGNNVGDCVIRALTKALGISWQDVYAAVSAQGYMMSDMPSSNRVWGAYLRKQGFERYVVDNDERYTVRQFCVDNPEGLFVIGLDGHVVCAIDGDYYDSWDSGDKVPLYIWTRERGWRV